MHAIPIPAVLRDQIAAIHIVRSSAPAQLVLPSSGMVLGFQISGAVAHGGRQLDPLGVTGMLRQARQFHYMDGTTTVLARFKPGAGRAFGVPACDLSNRSVGLDAMLGATLRPMASRILEAETLAGAIAALASLMRRTASARDPLVEAALGPLGRAGGAAGVAAVARLLQVSERQLSRRFLASVGIPPKRYAGLRRFERAMAGLRKAPSLADAALEAGYYDQPHFAREIRAFAGMTPRELARFLR